MEHHRQCNASLRGTDELARYEITTTLLMTPILPPARYAYDAHSSRPHTVMPKGASLSAVCGPLSQAPLGMPTRVSAVGAEGLPAVERAEAVEVDVAERAAHPLPGHHEGLGWTAGSSAMSSRMSLATASIIAPGSTVRCACHRSSPEWLSTNVAAK